MQIALIEPSGQRGLADFAYCLGNALVRRNHQVVLLTTAGHETASLPEAHAAPRALNPTLQSLPARDHGHRLWVTEAPFVLKSLVSIPHMMTVRALGGLPSALRAIAARQKVAPPGPPGRAPA